MQKLLNGQMQINEEFCLHGDGCSTQRRSLVCKAREEEEGSQSTAVKKWNIYGEAFLPFLKWDDHWGGPDEYWKKPLTRFIWIVAQNWVVATRSVKLWGSGDGFELQLGDKETHCAKCSLPQAVVKGALRNNFPTWKTYELVKLYSFHQTFVYALKCLNGSVKFMAFLSSFLQPEIQEEKLTFWL